MTRSTLDVRFVVTLLLVAVMGAMPIVAQDAPVDLKDLKDLKDWGPFAKPWQRYEKKIHPQTGRQGTLFDSERATDGDPVAR